MIEDTTSQEFFEQKYQAAHDPWKFATDAGEQARYNAIVRLLSHRRYGSALEPGCSIGVLTEQLAALCDRVDAIEISSSAAERAAERCAGLPQVHIYCGRFPEAVPPGEYDLVVLSEVGYYFTEPGLLKTGWELARRLRPGGILLAVHWLGDSEDHLLSGDTVHQVLGSIDTLAHEDGARYATFRIDRWTRA